MADFKKDNLAEDKVVYHYPIVDLENKLVKGVVTVDDRTYLCAHVDLYKGMIHVEKNAEEFEESKISDKTMIDEIRAMAEFIIDHQIDNYCKNFIN
ncbi:hypothetical protein [Kurthia sibirica]|uniref:Uncharacterized protein n=1 Tax=Kurthia sibirica TaxID=202750 RepID=A0A2U3AP27_9BACL|nr:hypothetical protein [Kurthia sibirica]PWI26266.1 hypothetical protein DEX24_04895 [Kurthia sibirica]GEK33881.1 hypothetical protein KSI01_14140 [Kurthia sibirica]